jgi:hypothetical protein
MALHENRTELERLLADVWDYEDGARRKTSLPKWLFAVTLTGAVLCTASPLNVVAPVTTTAAENTPVDKVSSENLEEDLDYRIAEKTKSLAGWRAFLEAHPNGPHAQAARAEIDRLLPTPPQPVETADQSPPPPATTPTPIDGALAPAPPAPPVIVENEPPTSPQPVEPADRSPPFSAAAQVPVQATQTAAPPAAAVMVETPSAQAVEVAEQPLPSLAATQTQNDGAQSPAPAAAPVVAENESESAAIPAVAPDAIAANPPLPQLRPRETAAAKSEEPKLEEPTHHSHLRVAHRQAGQPNVFSFTVIASARTAG